MQLLCCHVTSAHCLVKWKKELQEKLFSVSLGFRIELGLSYMVLFGDWLRLEFGSKYKTSKTSSIIYPAHCLKGRCCYHLLTETQPTIWLTGTLMSKLVCDPKNRFICIINNFACISATLMKFCILIQKCIVVSQIFS